MGHPRGAGADSPIEYAKGHGTGNDFVLLADLGGSLDLTPALVRALCDRRTGLGGDGVLRVVPTAKVDEVAGLAADAHWFMDYRNADGSVAEMCGNGVRVYARWLQRAGLVGPGELPVATRGGVKTAQVPDDAGGDVAVGMGPVVLSGASRDVTVASGTRPGLEVDLGNPHLVVAVDALADAGPLTEPPAHAGAAANVEFIEVLGPDHLRMRVHERGVGETLSCGTGAVAAAVATGSRAGRSDGRWTVDVPGGRLRVDWDGERATLTGPAEIVATGVLDPDWLARV